MMMPSIFGNNFVDDVFDDMFPFAFVKEIAAFRGDKIFWKREA